MTEQEQRIEIARACGFRDPTCEAMDIQIGPDGKLWSALPDYLHDLNAMHEAEKILTEKQAVFYLTKLLQVRYRTGADHGMIACMIDKLAFATAPQRAEAMCRTLWPKKWKE